MYIYGNHSLSLSNIQKTKSLLTHTLKYSPDQESLCYNCRALNKDCDKCRVSWKAEETAEFYVNHDASYFSDYYSLYYTGVGNPRPGGV